MTSYILTAQGLTLFHQSQIYACNNSHRAWDSILECLKREEWDEIVTLMRPVEALRDYTEGSEVRVADYGVFYNGEQLTGTLVDRILQMRSEGFNISPMAKFLENLQKNPSYRSRGQLYSFLEHNNMPITPDGCFMAYKRVNEDFTDLHSGSFDNSPGRVVKMSRAQVDDDPNRTCSAGLHVCSREYLKRFRGAKLVACKVNPADVVAVPTDYNFTKMRVAQYEVVEELPISLVEGSSSHWDSAVYDTSLSDASEDGYGDLYDDDDEYA